jgi:hypothetical protein
VSRGSNEVHPSRERGDPVGKAQLKVFPTPSGFGQQRGVVDLSAPQKSVWNQLGALPVTWRLCCHFKSHLWKLAVQVEDGHRK